MREAVEVICLFAEAECFDGIERPAITTHSLRPWLPDRLNPLTSLDHTSFSRGTITD
jgi:hypothetical protein